MIPICTLRTLSNEPAPLVFSTVKQASIFTRDLRVFAFCKLGESNSNWNQNKYQCAFPAMISEWRKIWNSFTPTSDSFPFGFMQLSTIDASNLTNANPNIPVIRWHQTADYGFVPNEAMEVREAEIILKIRNFMVNYLEQFC